MKAPARVTLAADCFRDRRTIEQLASDAALLQESTDIKLEQLWRERVAANIRRRLAAQIEQPEPTP